MRLLHAASSYPLVPGGSQAPFMEEMLEGLASRGHDVNIVVPRTAGLVEGRRRGATVIGASYAPAPLQVWGYGRSLREGNRLRFSALAMTPLAVSSMALKVRQTISQDSVDVVHLHWALPTGVLSLIVPPQTPVVVSIHGADARLTNGRLRHVVSRILERADAIVAASSPILDFVSESHPQIQNKSYVIPHGANAQLFSCESKSEARDRLAIDRDVVAIVAVGRLVRKKGFDRLIEAFSLTNMDRLHLYIAGTGPELANLTRTVPAAFDERIHFLGHQSREAVADLICSSDLVVIPSIADGDDLDSGPVVLVEALAAGRPVVTSRVGMAEDLINEGVNGIIIDPLEPPSLATAIEQALRHGTQLGNEARETFEELGDWRRVASDLEVVYTGAAEHRRSARS